MEEKKRTAQRKYSAAVPIGGVFVILAIIGLITVIVFSVQATTQLLDNSKEKEKFENIILPVLMFDPVPFENPSELDNLVLLRSSIWSAFVQNIDKYKMDDNGRISMAKGDVDVACAKLFGPEIKLEHQTFTNYVTMYYYDEAKQTYLVPIDGDAILYTPQVEEIKKEGDVLSLMVGYLASGDDWLLRIKGEKYEPTPDKYMIYQMKKVDDHYQLIAIKDPPQGAVPGVPPIQPQAPDTIQPLTPSETAPPPAQEEPEEPTEQPQEPHQDTQQETV